MELFFATSGILWLLPLAVLPIVFHIHARTKERVIDFPGAYFLVNPALPSAERRRQIEDVALLILRVVLIAAAIVALSGPRVKGWAVAPAAEKESEAIVLLLDDSPSLCLHRRDEEHNWSSTLGRIAGVLSADPRRRAALETASGTGWPLKDISSFSLRVRKSPPASIASGDRSLALARAHQILSEASEERRAVVFFTDLRRNHAEGEGDALQARWTSALKLFSEPGSPALIVVRSSQAPARQWNLETVDAEVSASASERVPVAGQPFKVRFRARCFSGAGRRVLRVETAPWQFRNDDLKENVPSRRVLERPLILAEGEVAEVEIPLLRPEPSALWVRASFEEADEWPYDDSVETVVRVRPKRAAFLWDARKTPPPSDRDRALQSTLFALDPFAGSENGRVRLQRVKEPKGVARPGALVALLYDPSGFRLSQEVSEQLRGAVEGGASLLWVPDLTGDPHTWPEPLPNRVVASDPLLPRALEGAEVKRNSVAIEAWRMAKSQTAHPLLRPFAGGRNGDLPGVHLRRRVRLAISAASADAREQERVLARFNDGLPALVGRRLGAGWIYQLACGIEPEGGLAESPAWPVLLSEFLELAADDTLISGPSRAVDPSLSSSSWVLNSQLTVRSLQLAGPWHLEPNELMTKPNHSWTFEVPAGASELVIPPLPETGCYRLHAKDTLEHFVECRIAHAESVIEKMPRKVCGAISHAARDSGGSVVEGTESLSAALTDLQPGRPLAPYFWLLFGLLMALELGLLVWRGRSA